MSVNVWIWHFFVLQCQLDKFTMNDIFGIYLLITFVCHRTAPAWYNHAHSTKIESDSARAVNCWDEIIVSSPNIFFLSLYYYFTELITLSLIYSHLSRISFPPLFPLLSRIIDENCQVRKKLKQEGKLSSFELEL